MQRRLLVALLCLSLRPAAVAAQEPPPLPDGGREPQGLLAEPDPITRAAVFVDRRAKGDLNNGWFVEFGKMISGAGWLSVGPGYRTWYGNDTALVEASAAVSVNGYRTAQARVELPKVARSRLALGAQARWVDFGEIDDFGVGPDTPESALTTYGVTAAQAMVHATLRPTRWLGLGAEIGVLSSDVEHALLERIVPAGDEPIFIPSEVALTIDTRNYPGHPTAGLLARAAAAHFEDRDSGALTFRRYQGELAVFVPMFGERVVLGLHGWVVSTETEDGRTVPFYLMPSLGGANTLRSYANYRFHDRHLALANIELRLAMMTHVDLALFADAGNVAPRVEDLDLDKQSFGAGLRLHTRRMTFARIDVAHGHEGWRVLLGLTDPFAWPRLERRAAAVPFVP